MFSPFLHRRANIQSCFSKSAKVRSYRGWKEASIRPIGLKKAHAVPKILPFELEHLTIKLGFLRNWRTMSFHQRRIHFLFLLESPSQFNPWSLQTTIGGRATIYMTKTENGGTAQQLFYIYMQLGCASNSTSSNPIGLILRRMLR